MSFDKYTLSSPLKGPDAPCGQASHPCVAAAARWLTHCSPPCGLALLGFILKRGQSHSMCCLSPASFCWEACFCCSFMLSWELILYSRLLLRITPLYYEHYKKCLTVLFCWERWDHFWFYTILSEADVDISEHTLPELRFSFLSSKRTGAGLLGNMVTVCLTSSEIAEVFSKQAVGSYTPNLPRMDFLFFQVFTLLGVIINNMY